MIYRALLVDPWERSITTLEYREGNSIKPIIHCEQNKVDTVSFYGVARDVQMIVDDEAGLKPDIPIFRLPNYRDPIPGRAFFLGVGEAGATASVPDDFRIWLHTYIQWTDMVTTGQLTPMQTLGPGHVRIGDLILRKKVD